MLQNAYLLAKIGADTAENEQQFAEILPKTGNYPTGPLSAAKRVEELEAELGEKEETLSRAERMTSGGRGGSEGGRL